MNQIDNSIKVRLLFLAAAVLITLICLISLTFLFTNKLFFSNLVSAGLIFFFSFLTLIMLFNLALLSKKYSHGKEITSTSGEKIVGLKEDELIADEGKYRSLFINSADAVFLWEVNESGKVEKLIEANEAACRMTGYTLNELLTMLPTDLNSEETIQQSAEGVREIVKNRSAKFEVIIKTKAGNKIDVEIHSHIFSLKNQHVILSICRDITSRKQIEKEMKLIKFSVDNASVGVLRTGKDGKILEVNKYICSLLGYSKEEICQKYIYEVDPDFPKEKWQNHRNMLRMQKSDSFETRHFKKNGELVPVEVTNTHIEFQGDEYSFSFVRDITERKTADQKIKNSLHEKELLLKEIHHRVKNNLQVISSLLFLQAQHFDNEEAEELFRISQNRVRTMALIHEKLYQSEDLASIDFSVYIKGLVAVLDESFGSYTKNINIEVAAEKIYLDINRAIPCGLIINELVTNSMKHAFEKIENGFIRIELNSDKENYSLIIHDNGKGIKLSTNIEESNSLGLRIVESLVQQLNGNLTLENAEGTKFIIKFPVAV